MSTKSKVNVLVGTRKGAFIFTSDERRKMVGQRVHVQGLERDAHDHGPARWAAARRVSHFVFGPTTQYSDDLGQTWTQARPHPG